MRPWKAVLGVGAACAACCAAPLLGGTAALALGTTTLAGVGATLMTCADELMPLATLLLGLGAVTGGVAWWRRRARRQFQAAAVCREGACQQAACATPVACTVRP